MAVITTITRQGAFEADVVSQVNANFQNINAAIGTATTGTTGSGSTVLSTSATLTTPVLTTPTITTPTVTGGTLTSSTLVTATLTTPSVTGLKQDVGNALTAVGTNVATALALTKTVNNVTTAGSGTGVILPACTIGAIVYVFNAGANAIQVYGAGADTIDTVAAGTGVPLTNTKRAIYIGVAAATWISAQLGVVSA